MRIKSKIFLVVLVVSFLFLFYFITHAKSQSQLEQQLREIEQQMERNTNINDLLDKHKKVKETFSNNVDSFTGMQNISSRPADNPEKEIQRRREIINSQYRNAKYMLGGLSEQVENPQIAEAIPVEGYIIVEGGEKLLRDREQIEREISYAIKEKFVGNLVVLKTYNIHTGKFENEKEYELDTLSTDIKVLSFAGKTCTKWSYYTPKTCDRYANFILYEIEKGEFYPNFSSEVVSISTVDNKEMDIEAYTPEVTFYAKDGLDKIPVSIGCTTGKWRLTSAELEKLLNMGAFTLKKEIGSKSNSIPSCSLGSTMTLHLKIKRNEPEQCTQPKNIKVEIIKPVQQSKYVFTDDGNTGRLILELEAKTTPSGYEDRIEWEIPEMEGSHKIIQPASVFSQPKGSRAEVMYKGLPTSVESFGIQKVKARINVDGCTIEDTKEIMLFYPRDAKNNPEGKYRNWFYYWKQTPAAEPLGQNVNIEFGGTDFDLCKGGHVVAIFKPDYLFKTIHVCDLTEKVGGDFKITIPLVNRYDLSTLLEKKLVSYNYIDTFAVIIIHEFTHFNHYHTWWSGKTEQQRAEEDRDHDGVPDRLEPSMDLDPTKFQTYWDHDEDFRDIYGDEEFLAYESTYDYPIGKFDQYDWGKPGKNWQE